MTKEYTFSTTEGTRQVPQNPEDTTAPTTLAEAIAFYQAIESWYGSTPIRVLELDHDAMTFKDVSELIIDRIDAADQNAAVDAQLNAEHERLEQFGWEQV